MAWDGCHNARDVGGLPTQDGGTLRPRALVRSDTSARLTPRGVEALQAFGVSRVVDLRGDNEIRDYPSAVARSPLYTHRPLVGPLRTLDSERGEPELAAVYLAILHECGELIAAAVAAVADAPPGAVMVHCHAGKDRTGILMAVLLRAIGVPCEQIVADYLISDECLAQHYADELADLDHDPHQQARLRAMQQCDPVVMRELIECLETEYGGAQAYLAASGMSIDAIDRLWQRLVQPAS